MAGTVLIDGRNALDPAAVRAAGPRVRGHRPLVARMQAVILVGGEGRGCAR